MEIYRLNEEKVARLRTYMPVMEKAAKVLDDMGIPFEMNALSAHRTPAEVEAFATGAAGRGIEVIVAGAGMAAHLPGVVAALTPLPVVGVPIKSSNSIDGWDSILSMLQMPSGIPVATVALDGAKNAAILAMQIIATGESELQAKMLKFKSELADKIAQANKELALVEFKNRVR